MNTAEVNGEAEEVQKPGAILAQVRMQKGYSPEYVASKLHLRVRVIELLELDEYNKMPEPVFIKGYLRAYAKLLDLAPTPLLELFNGMYSVEKKQDKALWQSRRETHHGEHLVRWVTGLFAVGVIIAVSMWWQKNKDSEHFFSSTLTRTDTASNKSETEIRLTDLSKMRSLLSSNNGMTREENASAHSAPNTTAGAASGE